MRIADLDTPCRLLDIDRVNANITTMMDMIGGTGVSLRPHFNTPKCPAVAELQLRAGAIGITVAKLGEAEVLADAGLGPILMANQVVGETKIGRLMAPPARGCDITVAVESEFNVRQLADGGFKRLSPDWGTAPWWKQEIHELEKQQTEISDSLEAGNLFE